MIEKLLFSLKGILDAFLRQPVTRKILMVAGFCLSSFITILSLLILLVWTGALGPLPNQEELMLAENPSASEVYSADSVLLGRFFIQERSSITYEQLPKHLVDALIATEDIRFYKHGGIDKKSLLRVMMKSMLMQMDAGGGSTLTQQLAKNLYPRKNYVFFSLAINKIREMIIATRLEQAFDKQTLLTLYLNTVSFGENTYGLEAASQLFFSVPTQRLTLDQSATLVGMLKANHYYNPRIYPERAVVRRNVVLVQMVKYDLLPEEVADTLKTKPLGLKYNKITHHAGPAPYFREYIRPELLAWCERYNREHGTELNLYTSGLKIYTTIDSRLQRYAEEAMKEQMSKLQEIFLGQWKRSQAWDRFPGMIDEVIRKSQHYKRLQREGIPHEEIMKEMKIPVPMTVFTWNGEREVTMSPVDSIKHYLKFLNAGVFALSPKDGAVRIWVGGIQHQYFQFDHVRTSTKRQVGSTFKPIVYASALEQGIRPCAFVSAAKVKYTNMEDWTPENSDENYQLKYSMPGALAHSVNTVSVQILEQAGISNTIRLARKMGIESKLEPVPSLALGTPSISMMEMVRAYGAFATEGEIVSPYYLTSVTSHEGNIYERFTVLPPQRAMSRESALMILHMLRRAVNEGGTGSGVRSRFGITNDIGAKTGTTQSNTDGWFLAVSPQLVIGAWVGTDDPRMRPRAGTFGQGARTALPIVGDFFRRANQDKALRNVMLARFPELDPSLARKIDCDFSKEEKSNFLKKIFVKEDKEKARDFNAQPKKKGFFKRLFGKKEKRDSL